MNLPDLTKNVKAVLFLVTVLIGFGGWMARLEIKADEGAKANKKVVELQEKMQQQSADLQRSITRQQEAILDIVKTVIGFSPEQIATFRTLPKEPDSTGGEWYEFSIKALLRYRIIKDSTGAYLHTEVDSSYWTDIKRGIENP